MTLQTAQETTDQSRADNIAKNRRIHEELFGLCCHEWQATGETEVDTTLSQFLVVHRETYACVKCGERVEGCIQPPGGAESYYCTDLAAMQSIIDKMAEIGMYNEELGFWLTMHSPFCPGDKWFGGFTPHGMTGWNGRADYRAESGSDTMQLAVANAALAYLDAKKAGSEGKG